MTTRTTIDPPDPTLLDIQPKFWFRDEGGKAHPVELEYLLPENYLLIEENCSGQRNKNLRVESQTYMRLPYFPGDIYFNDKAVISKHPAFEGMESPNLSAGLNGATLVWVGDEDIAPRVNAFHFEFVYEGKTYLVKMISDGSGYAITADGRRGYGASSNLVRLYHQTSNMLTIIDLSLKKSTDLRMMSCLATLLTAQSIGKIAKNLEKDKPNPLLVGKMSNIRLDLVGAERWTAGPF